MAFKMRNKIGRFAEDNGSTKSGSSLGQEEEERQEEAAKALSPGDRCQVEAEGMSKRGTIRYVGKFMMVILFLALLTHDAQGSREDYLTEHTILCILISLLSHSSLLMIIFH